MGMIRMMPAAVLAIALAACGEKAAPVEETAASLSGGLYELSAEVTELSAIGKGTPATKLKLGDKLSVKACVSAAGEPEPELFAEEGDQCKMEQSYARNGRISALLSCKREGMQGQATPAAAGTIKTDSFEGEVTTTTYFEDGNYRMVRKVSAHRLGDCPAKEPEKTS